ncbi:hypothetical protein THAOC_34425, partial [Thalassiosira oceanica]
MCNRPLICLTGSEGLSGQTTRVHTVGPRPQDQSKQSTIGRQAASRKGTAFPRPRRGGSGLYDRHVRGGRGPGRGSGALAVEKDYLVELTLLSDLEMSFFRRGREKCSRFNNFFPRPPTLRRQQQQQQQQQQERINAGPEHPVGSAGSTATQQRCSAAIKLFQFSMALALWQTKLDVVSTRTTFIGNWGPSTPPSGQICRFLGVGVGSEGLTSGADAEEEGSELRDRRTTSWMDMVASLAALGFPLTLTDTAPPPPVLLLLP